MEENVALDSKKQKTFVKSIRGIKKLIKKNEKVGAKAEPKKEDEEAKPEKPFSMRLKGGRVKKNKRQQKGLVYLSHIPHGFYEHQMTQYFKQFGVVTNVRVIRSKRTGNSKGFAFVEFKEPSVAQIVAETMNNYLMGKRLIKAAYIPPEKQKNKAFRKNWNAIHNPSSIRRLKQKKAFNAVKDEAGDLKRSRKLLNNYKKTVKKLGDLGIKYDFFTPVDVPEELQDQVAKILKQEDDVKEEKENKPQQSKTEQKNEVKEENVQKQNDKKNNKKAETQNEKKNPKTNPKVKTEPKDEVKKENVLKQNDKKNNKNETQNIKKANELNKKVKEEPKEVKGNKKDKPVKVNEKQQKEKEQKLKDAGVKSVNEFISLDESDSDDESVDFDSDEYEKMMESDDDELSSGASDESGDEDDDDDEDGEEDDDEDEDEDESEEEVVVPAKKGKPPPKVAQPVQAKKQQQKQQQLRQQPARPQSAKQQPARQQQPKQQVAKQQPAKQQPKQQAKKQDVNTTEFKRKAPQKQPAAAKKPKFEKQSQKPLKKQFKKK
ncbi:uncharacterized protein LOC142973729 [Anticarsia gemmatalis]|uniref:uncharacterized protein LOC142973729 n=1 Tax=Anticarsia gemmatalis TaxID=129554 RepID=UPI003F75D6EF